MIPHDLETRLVPKVIAVLCAYECAAITTHRLPTCSAGVWAMYRHPLGRPVLWLTWGWLTSHWFCVHGRELVDGG